MKQDNVASTGRRPLDQVREEATGQAVRIIAAERLAALTARRLAADTGCVVGTLYNAFGHLDGVIRAANLITLRALEAALAASLERLASDAASEDRLTALAEGYFRYAAINTNAFEAIFEHHPTTPADPRIGAAQERVFGLLVRAAGISADTATANQLTSLRLLWASVHGVVSLVVGRKINDVLAEDACRHLHLIVMAGLRGFRELVREGVV